ncbi:hypothetical protein BCR36DRAFT_583480 [Piromyces finnis]|uniref:Uncharacterized protein n=1 Tax=Piromyces finnis TaxID=1754191 RepID=A0A1Y1VBC2_9FUNG|nr:hypothetical protein BCR36DRAFT_583480 [Piromyces finnis]|eukprot:ORX50364.1 hypothetical protein BCR36DRAFT_583480 [Piromyces finnis]
MNQFDNCTKAIDDMCFLDLKVNKTELNETCEVHATKNCEMLKYNGIESLEDCQDIEEDVIISLNISFKILKTTIGLLCIKDENENFCPFSLSQIDNEQNSNENYMNALKENCYSKECTDKTLMYMYELLDLYYESTDIVDVNHLKKDEESIKMIIDFIYSSKCKSKHLNQTSNALYTLNEKLYGNILLLLINMVILPLFK